MLATNRPFECSHYLLIILAYLRGMRIPTKNLTREVRRARDLVLIGSRADFRTGDEVHPRPVSEKGE